MSIEDINKIIDRANDVWEAGACMGSGYDEMNRMTTLEEALVFFVLEDEVLSDEIDGGELYNKLTELDVNSFQDMGR